MDEAIQSTRGIDCCYKPVCPEPCNRTRRPSIRHCVNLCIEDGGFSAVVKCANPSEISVDIYRAGATQASDMDFNLRPVKTKGDTYYFALPRAFWSYPVGYYDAEIYYGDQYTKTVRLNLHSTLSVTKVSAEADTAACDSKPAPNIEKVVDCCCEKCGCDSCECCDNNEYPEAKTLCDAEYELHPLDELKQFINEGKICTRCEMTEWLKDLTERVENVDLPDACFETESITTILRDIDNLDEELDALLQEDIDS